MAATAYPLPRDRAGAREPADARPRRSPTPAARRAVRTRRRLTAIVVAGGLAFALRPVLLSGGDPLVVPGRAVPAAAAGGAHVYVVQAGDTLWSIARRVQPDRDPRALVDELSAQVHGTELQAGERLVLP